jgi:hypothetical protein
MVGPNIMRPVIFMVNHKMNNNKMKNVIQKKLDKMYVKI